MAKREDLHAVLVNFFGKEKVDEFGKPRVYFQPPAKLIYPCVIYQLEDYDVDYGDNKVHRSLKHYTVTLIDRNPNIDDFAEKMFTLQYCSFDRRFIYENLYHNVFNLYW